MRDLFGPQAIAPRTVDSRDIWLALGLAVYWAWSFALPRAELAAAPVNGAWAVNAACHAVTLLLLGCASLHSPHLGAGAPPSIAALAVASSLMCLGVLGMSLSGTFGSQSLAYLASALSGASAGLLAIQLIPLLARPPRSESRLFCLVGTSVLCATPLSIVTFDLPSAMRPIFLATLPFISAYGARRAWTSSEYGLKTATEEGARDAVSVPLAACSFLFAFFSSMGTWDSGESAAQGGYQALCTLTFVIMLGALALIAASGGRRVLIRLVFVFLPALAGGVLLVPFLVLPGSSLLSGTLINVGRDLFSVYLYTSLALAASARGRAVFATGLVVGVGDIGHTAAALASPALSSISGTSSLAVSAILLYLVFISVVLLLYPSRANRLLVGPASIDADTAAPGGTAEPPGTRANGEDALSRGGERLLDIAASTIGLSDREREVLPLLLTARTMVSIASELGISYNTAKTHASHIFRKAGVGSRDELASWVESLYHEDADATRA